MTHPGPDRACTRLEDGTAIYRVGEQSPFIRLDVYLKERIPKLSRTRIQEAIRTRVKVVGRDTAKPSLLLRPGDRVMVMPVPPPVEPEPGFGVPVLHSDDDLIVIDKPAGVLAHPSNHVRKGSVTYLLSRVFEGPLHLVHRLDRETSGVMVIARSAPTARALSAQMSRQVDGATKTYLAIVFGEMAQAEGVVDLPIGPAERSAVYVKRGVNPHAGRASRTAFRVMQRGGGYSLLEVTLATGRRHQIRVHLAAIGHAVVGDKLYGPAESHYLRFIRGGFDERMRAQLLAERHLLHARRLSFAHPRGGAKLDITAPLPADMRDFLETRLTPEKR